MLIVKIIGGLGNQMFQYAFFKALQNKFEEDVLLDLSWFEEVKAITNATQREYELGAFNLSPKFATTKQVTDCIDSKKSKAPKFIRKILNRPKFYDNKIFQKNAIEFEPELFEHKEKAYYEGYFQSEKYFSDIRPSLIKDFSLNADLDEKNQVLLQKIKENNSVSLHVRRGDYVNNQAVNSVHGICPLDYYKKAITHIESKITNPHFFLFSDDIDWVIENLKIGYAFTVVDSNQGKGWLDLELMKNCKHNIIANSSFSWWGAWLNQNPDKIVIAPDKWFNNSKLVVNDLFPDDWIKI